MSSQPEFNFKKAKARADQAVEAAYQNEYSEWKEDAYLALYRVAMEKKEFISDDVWKKLDELGSEFQPREPRAMGGVIRRAVSDKLIQSTGRVARSARVNCHGTLTNVWESLVYKGD